MTVPPEFTRILNDLNRDVYRARPDDVLQFCANWFNHRLEAERVALRHTGRSDALPLSSDPSPSGPVDPIAPDDVDMLQAPPTNTLFSSGFGFGFGSPFGATDSAAPAAGAPPTTRSSWDSASTESDDDTDLGHALQLNTAMLDMRRRTSVSAESLPVHSTSNRPVIPQIPKTDEQLARLRQAVQNHFLFNNLEEEQYSDVLLAMKEVAVPASKVVIEQGQEGDYFYVVGSGTLEVYKRAEEGSFSSANSAEMVKGSDYGDLVASYGPGEGFGELALMYAQPRAATVMSTSACTLWAMDRITFRTILLDSAMRRRQLFDSFLKEVPLFERMRDEERVKLVDALQIKTFDLGSRPVKQGERGREFFVIIDGYAEVRKLKPGVAPPAEPQPEHETTLNVLSRGDYFGELALLYQTPRAASVVVTPGPNGAQKLKVARLSEKQFTRLLGPLIGIMSRNAKERYGTSAPLPRPVWPTPAVADVGPDDFPPENATPAAATPGTWITASPFA